MKDTKMAKGDLWQKFSPEEWQQISDDIKKVHDRSAALIIVSMLELVLEIAIIARFPNRDKKTVDELRSRDGALSGFYKKIYLAYAMGIYEAEIRNDLDLIRKIRNNFAHSPISVTFATEKILKECLKLKNHDFDLQTLPEEITFEGTNTSKGRVLFMGASINILNTLVDQATDLLKIS